MLKKRLQAGFSLFEVMIFVTLLNIIFISSASFVVSALFKMKINEHRMLATYYIDDLKEWLTSEREADWAGFQTFAGRTYCVNANLNLNTALTALNAMAVASAANCNFTGIGNINPRIYRRTLTLTQNGPNQVTADIDVAWNETGADGTLRVFNETIQLIFTSWQ